MSEKKLRILLTEGDPAETTAALRELYPESQDGLELTIVSTIPTLTATLEIVNPEVIFVDLSLAHPDPLGAVRRVHRSAPDVPLIVLADDPMAHLTSLEDRARVIRLIADHLTSGGRVVLEGLYRHDGMKDIRRGIVEESWTPTAVPSVWRASYRCKTAVATSLMRSWSRQATIPSGSKERLPLQRSAVFHP